MEAFPQHFDIGSNGDPDEESPPGHEQQKEKQRLRVVPDAILHCLRRQGFDTSGMRPASHLIVSPTPHVPQLATRDDFWPAGAATSRAGRPMEPPSGTPAGSADGGLTQVSDPPDTSRACATCGVAPKGRGRRSKLCVLCGTQGSSRNHVHPCYDPTCRSPTCKRCWQGSPYCQGRCWEHGIMVPLPGAIARIDSSLPPTQPPPPPEQECALPHGWHSAYSNTDSKWYYWRDGSDVSTWDAPTP